MSARFPKPNGDYYERKQSSISPKSAYPRTTSYENDANKNSTFDIHKLHLIPNPHRSRFILSFPLEIKTYSNNIFYNQLSEKNRRAINEILFQLYDKFMPDIIDTNCGNRTSDNFHCKLIYHGQCVWEQIVTQSLADHVKNGLIAKYIAHYEKVADSYITKHKEIDLEYFQNDLNVYLKYFRANNKMWYPKISPLKTFSDRKYKNAEQDLLQKAEKIQFDINNDQLVLYEYYDTNESKQRFKMIHHSEKINTMIDDILDGMDNLIKRIRKENKSEYKIDENKYIGWFSLKLTTFENKKSNIVISVGVHISIICYLYFIFICKQQWLESDRNKQLFQKWFDKYCGNIIDHDDNKENIDDISCDCDNFINIPINNILDY